MREEPVLYINGQPFVLREADKPFSNVEYTGIDAGRVEDMERRLKDDVLQARDEGGLPAGGRFFISCLLRFIKVE